MALLKKSVSNKKPAMKTSTKAGGTKKMGLKKATGAATKIKAGQGAKKDKIKTAKKEKIKTAKKSLGSKLKIPASAKASSKAGSGILNTPKKMGQKKKISPAKKSPPKAAAAKKTELAAKKAKASLAMKRLDGGASAKKASTAGAASKKNPAAAGGFNLNQFMEQKLGPSATKQGVSGSRRSSLADLIKFNTQMAHSFYKVSEEDGLETVLYVLQAEEDVKKLAASPGAAAAYSEVVVYRDLLLLGDLATISQEKRPYQWLQQAGSLSGPAQTALMTSLLGLAIKLTGRRPSRLDTKLPGGKVPGKARGEVLAYLALIQNIADAMTEANKGYKTPKSAHLRRMHADLAKIIGDF